MVVEALYECLLLIFSAVGFPDRCIRMLIVRSSWPVPISSSSHSTLGNLRNYLLCVCLSEMFVLCSPESRVSVLDLTYLRAKTLLVIIWKIVRLKGAYFIWLCKDQMERWIEIICLTSDFPCRRGGFNFLRGTCHWLTLCVYLPVFLSQECKIHEEFFFFLTPEEESWVN